MSWYLAKVIFKIEIGPEGKASQFDEHLRLIQANSFEEAFVKARLIGITEEDNFMNDHQQSVKWEFVNVTELIPLKELRDGVEVYSQIHETEEARSYIQAIHQKAATLQLNHSPAF